MMEQYGDHTCSLSLVHACHVDASASPLFCPGINISGANKSLRANYGNFNLGHQIKSKGRGAERWEGRFEKV